MDKFRNFINKATQKYTNFKAKIVSFRNKFLKKIYRTMIIVEVKLKRFKFEINYHCDKLIEWIKNYRIKIGLLIQYHRINKSVSLEAKLNRIRTKIRAF